MGWQIWTTGRLVEHGDDTTRTVTVYGPDGTIASTRAYTAEESAAADHGVEQDATLTDLAARIARIEAVLWPAPPDPASISGVQTLAQQGGVWPAGGLLLDAGQVWRNVTTVPLTTAPSGFPGGPDRWGHLFAPVTVGTPPPTYPAWSPTAAYAVGDRVTDGGSTWQCLIAHGPERQGTWRPGPATTGTVWALA